MAFLWPSPQEFVDADLTNWAMHLMFGDGNCAISGCVRPARDGHLMCAHHWWLVPRPLRDPVWRAYRAYTHGSGDLESLRAAQQAAVDAVTRRSTA